MLPDSIAIHLKYLFLFCLKNIFLLFEQWEYGGSGWSVPLYLNAFIIKITLTWTFRIQFVIFFIYYVIGGIAKIMPISLLNTKCCECYNIAFHMFNIDSTFTHWFGVHIFLVTANIVLLSIFKKMQETSKLRLDMISVWLSMTVLVILCIELFRFVCLHER